MPTFRAPQRATTKGKEQRPWSSANKVKHPQFLPHLQFFRWVHLKNNPGKGKAVRPYHQSVADARLLRTAIRDRLSHWGNGDAPAGGWGADLLVEAPGWTREFLAQVEPVEGEEMPEDDAEEEEAGEEGEDYFEEAEGAGLLHGWGHEEGREEVDEGASVGGGGSVALSALREAEISKPHEKMKIMDALLESAEFKALSPADKAKRLLDWESLSEAWEGSAPATYEKGKERRPFDKKMATAVMKAWPMPKEGETSSTPAYVARLNAFLAKSDPIPGYTAKDADRERLLQGGVKAINFLQGGGKKTNEMLRREDETPAEFSIRQKTLRVPWGGAKATGANKGETVAQYIVRIKEGWRAKNPGESDADFIKAFEEAKGSTTTTYPQGVGNLRQFLTDQTDAEGSSEYYLDLARGKRDIQQGKETRHGEKVKPTETKEEFEKRKQVSKTDLRSSIFPFVGKNPFDELKEGRGDLAYDVGRFETDEKGRQQLVGSEQEAVKLSAGRLLKTPIGFNRPWSDLAQAYMTGGEEPHPVPVRRKRDGKTEFYVGGEFRELNAKEFDDLVAKPMEDSLAKQIENLEISIAQMEEGGKEGEDYDLLETHDKPLLEVLKEGGLKQGLRRLKLDAGLVRRLVLKKKLAYQAPAPGKVEEEGKATEAEVEAEAEAEAGELVDIIEKDDEKVYNAYLAHLASQSPPVVGEKAPFFERLNELMARHSMGLEDVEAGLERLKEYKAGGMKGKVPMEHAFADPKKPGSLAKLKVAKGAGDDGVGFISSREGAKKETTKMAPDPKLGREGVIKDNPNKGLSKPDERGKLMWRPPTVKGERASEPVEVPEGEIFPVRLSSSEKFQQGGKDLDQWKTYGEGKDGGGHLPATARAFIDPVNKNIMRIYAFEPPREIAQGEKDPENPGWRVRKIDPQFLPAVQGGSMKIEPGRPVGRPYRDIDARLATLTAERQAMIDEWATFPEWLRNKRAYKPTMEGRIIGGEDMRHDGRGYGKGGYGGAGLYLQAPSRKFHHAGRAGRAEQRSTAPQFKQAFLAKQGLTQEAVEAMWNRMEDIYFRDEDTGSEFDRLKLTGDSRGSLGGEAWGRAGVAYKQGEAGKRRTLAELRGKPLRERAEALSQLTEEEKNDLVVAGKSVEEAQRSKTARVLRELQKRGLLPDPGATRAEGVGGDLEWATSVQLGVNEKRIRDDLITQKGVQWLKANPGKRYTPWEVDSQIRKEAEQEAQAMVASRRAQLQTGEGGLAFAPASQQAPKEGGGGGGGGGEPKPKVMPDDNSVERVAPYAVGVAPKDRQRAEDVWMGENPDSLEPSTRPVFDRRGGRLTKAMVRISRNGDWERYDYAEGEGEKRAWQDAGRGYRTGGEMRDLPIGTNTLSYEDGKNGLQYGKKYKDLMSSPHDPDEGQWWLEEVFTTVRPIPNLERRGGDALIWVCEMEADGAGGVTKVCRAPAWCNSVMVARIEEENAQKAKGKPKARLPSEYRE